MKGSYIRLLILSALMVLAAFVCLWTGSPFLVAIPLSTIYFAVITGVMLQLITKSILKDPRTFIKMFMGITVGTLFLHLAVLTVYLFTHLSNVKVFTIWFCIHFAVYLTFLTVELILFIKRYQKEHQENKE